MFNDNFNIYFARLCRHFMLSKQLSDIISFLDLSHSFRCLVDIKTKIDDAINEDGYKLKFQHINNRRKLKRNALEGITIHYMLKLEDGLCEQFGFVDKCISDEELDDFEYIQAYRQAEITGFSKWLNWEVASIKYSEGNTSVTIEETIRRISNKFSGSHPYETEHNEDSDLNCELKNRLIDRIHMMQINRTHLGYLIIQSFAEELLLAIIDYLLENKSNPYNDMFIKCKRMMENAN
jgi:hypothetical protein